MATGTPVERNPGPMHTVTSPVATDVNREPVDAALLAGDDEVQIDNFRPVYLTESTTDDTQSDSRYSSASNNNADHQMPGRITTTYDQHHGLVLDDRAPQHRALRKMLAEVHHCFAGLSGAALVECPIPRVRSG